MDERKTDWDKYYSAPAKTAPLARKVTEKKILDCFRQHMPSPSGLKITELGGANSCFYSAIQRELSPNSYRIIDNNRIGLDKFLQNNQGAKSVTILHEDILTLGKEKSLDLDDIVFSTGLIEHFSPSDTREMIRAHFRFVRPGGLVLITFPTPTWLYRITRKFIEMLGMWIFHDERPLMLSEVSQEVLQHGDIVHSSITWPIFLTQGVIVARAK